MNLSKLKELKTKTNKTIDDLVVALNTQEELAELMATCEEQIAKLMAKKNEYQEEMIAVCGHFNDLVACLDSQGKSIKTEFGLDDADEECDGDDDDDFDDDDEDWDDEDDEEDDDDEEDEVEEDEVEDENEPDGTL